MHIVIGIDASRNRSGGAIANIIGVLSEYNPEPNTIKEIHIWAFKSLLDKIPKRSWIVKHNPTELEKSLYSQIYWQATKLKREATLAGCNILYSTDASTLCRFKPMVVMSQDLLSYEPGVMQYFGYSVARLRLIAILLVQNRAFRFADGVIFLTKYAAKLVQQSCGQLPNYTHIPHGIDSKFLDSESIGPNWYENKSKTIRCLYVSNTEMYKHQWEVVNAISHLKKSGYNLSLKLVGGGSGEAQSKLEDQVSLADPHGTYIKQIDFLPHKYLPGLLSDADIFIFASSCENMPITLLEAMATGLPIACSNRGPMPEILDDGGVYFNPEDSESITYAVKTIIDDSRLSVKISQRAKSLAGQYNWSRAANETFQFIINTLNKY